jgi:hypothetical protein
MGAMSTCQTGFFVNPPLVVKLLPVRIFATCSVEGNDLFGVGCEFKRTGAELSIQDDFRIVICVGKILDRPVHARGKVVLISLAPAPDRCLI